MTTNDHFLRACRRQPTERTPVWFMRQAGRYMPEYRAIREHYSFLEMVKTPDLAAQITLQPIRALPVDAAIIYSDILPPMEGMGLQLTYEKGEGPVIHNPVRTLADIAALRHADPYETMAGTLEAIRIVRRELATSNIPLIGFSGAPFTLASYAIEGSGSRDYRRTKLLMYREPQAWHQLMEKLSLLVSDYLIAQIAAGAQAVQIFDSWAGALAPSDYVEYVLPHIQSAIGRVRASMQDLPPVAIPIIYFGTDMAGMGAILRQTGADVLGVDWRIGLDDAWQRLGTDVAVQGNLDPAVLFAPISEIERRAADILQRAGGRPGHIFNLGHGIMTETPGDHVRQLAEFVQNYQLSPALVDSN